MVQSGRGTGVSVERGLSFQGNNLDTISTNHASFPGVADRDAHARPESTPTWSCTDNPCTRWIRSSGCLSASHGLCVTLRVRIDAEGCAGSRERARNRRPPRRGVHGTGQPPRRGVRTGPGDHLGAACPRDRATASARVGPDSTKPASGSAEAGFGLITAVRTQSARNAHVVHRGSA